MNRSMLSLLFAAALVLPAGLAFAQEDVAAPVAVQFAADSDELDDAAKAALTTFAAARAAGADAQALVQISGHGDPGEVAQYAPQDMNYCIGLAQRRANQVRSFLALQGVKDGDMTTLTFGCTRPIEGGDAAHNRRVELELGAASGW